MTDEIGRREFLKRGSMAGVIATTGIPVADVLARVQPAAASVAQSCVAAPEHPHRRSRRAASTRRISVSRSTTHLSRHCCSSH